MKRLAMSLALGGLGVLGVPQPASACTTFMLDGPEGHVVGKSYDWHMGQGVLVSNPAGRSKHSLLVSPSRPARWISRYGSLTFNQYGLELPNGGVNEAGLVVEIMWLKEAGQEPVDRRPAINELQWIQMQLDLRASVKEVLQHLDEVRVERVSGKVHYMVCDATGTCATVEALGSRLVVHPEAQPRALTNDPYEASRAYAQAHAQAPRGHGSLPRFARAAQVSVARHRAPVVAAFELLDSVQIPNYTKWQIVYDTSSPGVHFRTSEQRAIKTVRLKDVLHRCAEGPFGISVQTQEGGAVGARLLAWTPKQNEALVRASLGRTDDPVARRLATAITKLSASFSCAQ